MSTLKSMLSGANGALVSSFTSVTDSFEWLSDEVKAKKEDRKVSREVRREIFLKELAKEVMENEESFQKAVDKSILSEETINGIVDKVYAIAEKTYKK
nr:MAG TPA: hypothetical protein [Caudoviricetes sp.]